jgi:MerR family transcriptional regulator/heat shock protein HspR
MHLDENNRPVFTIGTVARMLGVSVATLRLYERKGLLLVQKSDGNQRLYSKKDVERLLCIRSAINENKISIEGIRRIHSMIPCWEYVQCPPEQRPACPAYNSPEAGCWTYKHQANACADRICVDCEVYRLASDCGHIKQIVYQRLLPNPVAMTQSNRENET